MRSRGALGLAQSGPGRDWIGLFCLTRTSCLSLHDPVPARLLKIIRVCAIALMLAWPVIAAQAETLREVSRSIAEAYPEVPVIPASDLARRLASGDAIILLDVRNESEYAVSHIPGAVRIDPGANLRGIERVTGSLQPDDTIVLYCSVGYRSSRLGRRLLKALGPGRSVELFSLEGGIFQWHNEFRPLEDEAGATHLVHPFNADRESLLRRREYVSRIPQAHPS